MEFGPTLAEYVKGVTLDKVPKRDIEVAKLAILDQIGVALAGRAVTILRFEEFPQLYVVKIVLPLKATPDVIEILTIHKPRYAHCSSLWIDIAMILPPNLKSPPNDAV